MNINSMVNKLEAYPVTHKAQLTSLVKMSPAAQPGIPEEINSTGVYKSEMK